MANVRRICERTILIDHGSILVDSTPDEAIALYSNLMNLEVVAAH
jgi:ABC-type polysaccharide/polyol phosphate transport system ATPase subunit